jgi:uncharacterized protein (DUF1810 family)
VDVEPARLHRSRPSYARGVPDDFDLDRFVTAQESGGTYERALSEIRRGRKVGHWMWYVFPQVAGLGSSPMAQKYAISSLAEARAYVAHPVLGPRLRECATSLIGLATIDPVEVLGSIDALKLRSCMTLFDRAAPEEPVFARVLDQYYDGSPDEATIERL